MTLGEIIAEARILLQDTRSSLYRYSDADLLKFGNQTLKRMAVLRPDLFAIVGEITCTAGEVLQSAPADSLRIMEIFSVKDGSAIRETNRETFDQSYPNWMNVTASACVNWMRHPRNNNKFFIYPKAPVGQILIGEYAQTPPTYTANDTILLLSDAYYTVILDGLVYVAESIDNEHVSSGRAALFQKAFADSLAVNMEQRKVTDNEAAGLQEEKAR
jgi:hypothetical protein